MRASLWAVLALGAAACAHGGAGARGTQATSGGAAEKPSESAAACAGGKRLTVHFYDVGEALAALVDLPDGRHVLVDTGDSPARPGCGMCSVYSEHLLRRLSIDLRESPIDLVWITHQHSDHLGGAPEVLRAFKVGALVDNGRDLRRAEVRRAREAAEERGVAVHVVDPEHRQLPIADTQEVRMRAILPAAWPLGCDRDPNECSIGLRLDYCQSSVLFLGDAEREEEAVLDPGGTVTLLQVAHHGSDTSTGPAFLAQATPRYAVISAGKRGEGPNRDDCHPRAAVVDRLSRALGGAPSAPLEAFGGPRCDRAKASDWVDAPATDRLWATERDGDIVVWTTGDGAFARQAQ
ncbi:MAG TPA: MBL fold metallo-hydrolase [Polyangiaceae bacterium]|nr:MBL fold metallo-hydrolase [Polyangiaceae bacterium]